MIVGISRYTIGLSVSTKIKAVNFFFCFFLKQKQEAEVAKVSSRSGWSCLPSKSAPRIYEHPLVDLGNCCPCCAAHPVKIDLNKKLDPKQKTIQAFNIDP